MMETRWPVLLVLVCGSLAFATLAAGAALTGDLAAVVVGVVAVFLCLVALAVFHHGARHHPRE